MSTETLRSARSSSKDLDARGCSTRSLSVEYRWCGMRNVLDRFRIAMAGSCAAAAAGPGGWASAGEAKEGRTVAAASCAIRQGLQACTIIAKNYLHFARVLARSFHEHHPGGRFWVLV